MTMIMEDNLVTIKNINALENQAHTVFVEYGYSTKTIYPFLCVAKTLIRLHNEQGEEQLSKAIVDNYVRNEEVRFKNGEYCKSSLQRNKNAAEYLTQIYNTGKFTPKRHNPLPPLPDSFAGLISDILANESWGVKFREHQRRLSSTFFRWLCSRGYNDINCVDERVAREYLVDCSSRMTESSLYNVRKALKDLLLFTSENGTLSEEMNKLFLFRISVGKKMRSFIPQDEIAAVLNIINRTTQCGKRNYAIILLAAVTGLRGIDIVNLTMNSIDWTNGEIRIIQEKTGNSLALPLTTGAGKAIRKYVLETRPHSKSEKIFISSYAPFEVMKTTTLNYFLKKYCRMAGLQTQHTFHSLRRSLATNMVTSGVSVITVAQALGHREIDSTKQYISLDSKNLKECALDFSGIQVGGGLL